MKPLTEPDQLRNSPFGTWLRGVMQWQYSIIRQLGNMKLVLALVHGAVVVLLAMTAGLYPGAATWALLAIGFTLWFGGLSFILAACNLQVAAQIAGYCINGLAMLTSLGVLAGYAFGQKWCLILAAGVACFSGIVTVIIARFYPPEADKSARG